MRRRCAVAAIKDLLRLLFTTFDCSRDSVRRAAVRARRSMAGEWRNEMALNRALMSTP